MKYDIIVIGSGPGGYVAAIRAAQLGKKVAVVERAEAGGVCLNWGCIPTKALLKSAQVYNYCKSAEHYGLDFAGEVRPNLEKIVARSRGVAETMNKGVLFLLKKNNVELINGFAKLKGNGRIDVDGTEYEADHIILATGARPREMPFMPIDGEHVISSKQALVLPKLPETMIVVGSGAIGSEFAYFYAALGVKVTIVEYLPQIMPLEDEEVAKTMERSFRKLKATILTSTTVKSVKVNAEGKCDVEVEGKKGTETLVADIVLSAVGIKSNIEGIGLEELGIKTERDKVIVDKQYRTNVPGIYAIGDIVPGPALAHVASAEALCCVNAIRAGGLHDDSLVRIHLAGSGFGRYDRTTGQGDGYRLQSGTLPLHRFGQSDRRWRPRRLRKTDLRPERQAAGSTSGGSERNRNAGRADARQIAGSDGTADRTHNPRTPDHERRSYGGGRGSSGCRDPRINRKLPQCERGRPAQDRPRFICIRPSRSNR